MDLKKEIKLSDLVPRRKPKQGGAKRAASSNGGGRKRKPAKRELVGLKVGASQLAASRVVNNGSANLVQLARGPLDAGIVVGGEVRDVPALAKALDAFFTKNKLPRRGVRLGLATNRIGVRAFDVDGIADEKQLGNAIRFRAHEAVSIPIDEAVLDYHIVNETVDDAGAVSRRIVLAAAYRESIDRYLEAFRAAKIELHGIDLEAFALLRAVGPAVGRRRRRSGSGGRRRLARPRPLDPRDLRRRPSASSHACSSGAAASSRPRSRSTSPSRPTRRSS